MGSFLTQLLQQFNQSSRDMDAQARGVQVQVGEPQLNQGQMGNEMALPEQAVNVPQGNQMSIPGLNIPVGGQQAQANNMQIPGLNIPVGGKGGDSREVHIHLSPDLLKALTSAEEE